MAGKAYTMREMRAIVEYLTERKAYGEIKGRKMWMEYANSQHTTRSWQSLKETFLKRILPSIHDPYYKLSMDQVRSFREGYDIADKDKNYRLEFRSASGESNSNAESRIEKQPTSKDIELQTTVVDNEVGKLTGEGFKCEKISSRNRSSADTVVLEYENAEDVQRALESPRNDEHDNELTTKSFKDLLTFEPMTPLVKELIDAFETESEESDKEPQLQIDENPSKSTEPKPMEMTNSTNQNTLNVSESVIEVHDSEDSSNKEINDQKCKTSEHKPQEDTAEHNNNDETNTHNNTQESNKEPDLQNNEVTNSKQQDTTEFVTAESLSKTCAKSPDTTTTTNEKNTNTTTENHAENNTTENPVHSTQNTGNTSSDTILPNNQEALDSKKSTQKTNLDKTGEEIEKVNINNVRSEKRLNSQDTKEAKKQKLSENDTNQLVEDDRTTPIIEVLDSPIIENDTTSNKEDTTSSKEKNIEISNKNIIEIDNDTPAEDKGNPQNAVSKIPVVTNKPNESAVIEVSNAASKDKDVEIIEDKNPCLLSVSLFDEQFKHTKYDSDSDDEATPVPKQNVNKDNPPIQNKPKETNEKPHKDERKVTEVTVVENRSKENLEPSTEPQVERTNNNPKVVDNITIRMQREKALANIFGFAHGAASTSRKRQLSPRKRSHQQHRKLSKNIESNSSEYTTESDSESYVSPPRGRRNRQTRKYLKPKSSRILQDPEEGMLYAFFGKNIYPLVKDGKHKNFLLHRPDSSSDREEESYWRQKYVEEKKRVNEFKKLLEEERGTKTLHINDPASPVSRTDTTHQRRPVQNGNCNQLDIQAEVQNKTDPKNEKLILKIAAKNGLECCLEGGWTQISNAMPQMVQMLRHEIAPNSEKSKPAPNTTEVYKPIKVQEPVELSSGRSTPLVVDPEVKEKVNKIETEIFKEIEEREMEEINGLETSNVTKRKLRHLKESSTSISSTQSPAKRTKGPTSTESIEQSTTPAKGKRKTKITLKVPKQTQETIPNEENKSPKQTQESIPNEENKSPKLLRTSSRTKAKQQTTEQQSNETVTTTAEVTNHQQNDSTEQKQPNQRENQRISRQKKTSELREVSTDKSPAGSSKSSVREVKTPKKYGTDTSGSEIRLKTTSKESTELLGIDEDACFMFPPTQKEEKKMTKRKNSRSLPKIHILPIKENTSGNSIDSALGYRDSDISPTKICLSKRKRIPSFTTRLQHKNRRLTRRKSFPSLLQDLSSDSNKSSYFIPLRKTQSTLNSEVYKTESFQLLMPKQKHSFNNLAPIAETDHIKTQLDPNVRHFSSFSKDSDKSSNDNSNINVDVASSSNISLTLSPELSIVEKLSISREVINSDKNPTTNEVHSNRKSNGMDISDYMISNLDVSVPLMNQQCEVQNNKQKLTPKKNTTKSTPFTEPKLTECTVRIENLTLSESLDQRLRDLLLESNKKLKNMAMEVDQTHQKVATAKKPRANNQPKNAMELDKSSKPAKKPRAKRSSTPRKKKTAKKTKSPQDPIIEEEHRESCSIAGRQSCPPVITLVQMDENANNCDVTLNTEHVTTRKKKDIIKVKIERPKAKRGGSREVNREKSAESSSTVSIYTDSGIIENGAISEVFSKEIEDSVDLIHNHSETCLRANECIRDYSVEFVSNSNSIISLNSSPQSIDELQLSFAHSANLSGELNAQEKASGLTLSGGIFETPVIHYVSPTGSSLISEDLSDDPPPTQPTKWYLLSDDETTTQPETNIGSYGSNLNHIFPIICAVPNLSTISEMSKDNENSNKQSIDSKK